MNTEPDRVDAQDHVIVQLRPVGNPLPLGFFAFGIGMLLLSGVAAGLITGEQVKLAGVLLAAFVFPLEMLAAVFAFLARDTGAAGALGLFATSWLGQGLLHVLAPDSPTSTAVGVFLAGFAVMLLPLAVAALLGKRLLGLVLLISATRAGVAAAYQLGAPLWVSRVDAAGALLLFLLSLYAGTAFLFEDLRQRTVLPVVRRGPARQAIEADLGDQFTRLPNEPGVRQQL